MSSVTSSEQDQNELSSDTEAQVEEIVSESDNELPETLKQIFKREAQPAKQSHSIFAKNRGENISSLNVEDEKMRKANAVFESMNIFKGLPINSGVLKPMFNEKLEKKERQKQKEATAGKAWGSMPKVELTEELRNDLKAIKFRNQIFPKRFYKNNDSENLPKYFQIGTVVESGGVGNVRDRLKKKEQKRTIAQQFLMDDEAAQFSKRKYEMLNDKRRRMGIKKRDLLKNKARKTKAI